MIESTVSLLDNSKHARRSYNASGAMMASIAVGHVSAIHP
jgi:hypothetical protein